MSIVFEKRFQDGSVLVVEPILRMDRPTSFQCYWRRPGGGPGCCFERSIEGLAQEIRENEEYVGNQQKRLAALIPQLERMGFTALGEAE